MALDPRMRRTASFVEHAFLRDPTQWSTQNACVEVTKQTIGRLIAAQPVRRVDVGTAARLLCGTTVNAVFWVAASEELRFVQPNHRNKRHRQHHHQKFSNADSKDHNAQAAALVVDMRSMDSSQQAAVARELNQD
ncbi:hypothetical protein HED48_23145 [Ochrobactrum intermedium]|nr:hypothetical protein [Brucella intermedia]